MQQRQRTDPLSRRIAAYATIIRNLREDHDLSQKDIGQILGISQRAYADYENGVTEMTVSKLLTLAEYYNVSMDYICGLTHDMKPFHRATKVSEKKKIKP